MQLFKVKHVKKLVHAIPAMQHQTVVTTLVLSHSFMAAQAEVRSSYDTDSYHNFVRHLGVEFKQATILGELKE